MSSEPAPEHINSQEQLVVPLEAFIAADFEAPIATVRSTEMFELAFAYEQTARNAQSKENATVFGLMAAICHIHLRDDRAEPWGPMYRTASGRGAIPTDFKGEQSKVFLQLLDRISHPALKARLADIVWTNNRAEQTASSEAVASYCTCVERLLNGTFALQVDKGVRASMEAYTSLQRAFQIARATHKKGELPDNVSNALRALYEQAKTEKAYLVFTRAAQLGLDNQLLTPEMVAPDAEVLANSADLATVPDAVRAVFDFGGRLYAKMGDKASDRRCRLGSAAQMLAMCAQCGQAGAKASWVMNALRMLEHVEGVENIEMELEQELRRLQKQSTKEMVAIPLPLDLEDDKKRTAEVFEPLNLSDSLMQFALIDRATDDKVLRERALKTIQISPLMATMSMAHIDGRGRVAAKTPGADFSGSPSEEWFNATINRDESIQRVMVVGGYIEPARVIIMGKFGITEEHLYPIVTLSPFVPSSQAGIMALGFARLFQGDYISATHLLIPQIEPCLRHILRINGCDPTKRYPNSTEEDRSLGGLIFHMRAELEQIFSKSIVCQIERLFDTRPGPGIRHELAHGQIGTGGCFHADVIYGCWLIYRLTCLFLMKDWQQIVALSLQATV